MPKKEALITSRDRKGRAVVGLFEAAFDKARLDGDQAQNVFEQGDKLQQGVRKLLTELSVNPKFADEEVSSSYGYPDGYRAKDICLQSNLLRQILPGVGFHDEQALDKPLPESAEGWFAIPRWENFGKTYGEALEVVLKKLAETRKFRNWREDQLGPDHLKPEERSAAMFRKLGDQQKGYDILLVPIQFGLRHRGRSVRRARAVMSRNEFGLGAFAVACLLLTHPERLVQWEQLHIDCPGDEYSPGAGGCFGLAPFFGFRDGRVRFDTRWSGCACGCCGSVSGFFPE